MAFLRQCLQALCARQGDPDTHFLNDPEWLEECGKSFFMTSHSLHVRPNHQLTQPTHDASTSPQIQDPTRRRD
jgi:hypothetical protein